MRFASLGSGSKGNATLVQADDTLVLVDCGFTLKEVEKRLQARNIHPKQLAAILVTHEHGDHLKGAPSLSRRYQLPLYTTLGTARFFKTPVPYFKPIQAHQSFQIGSMAVEPVTVPHDAREPTQFVFHHQGLQLGLLTDLGSITPWVVRSYRGCHGLMLECNHDCQMLAEGPYPASLKRRVGSDWGHLSNDQAAALLSQLDLNRLQHLMISHISEQNNDPDLARSAIDSVLSAEQTPQVHLLSQQGGSPWICLEPDRVEATSRESVAL